LIAGHSLSVIPRFLEAPKFTKEPKIIRDGNTLTVDYKLDANYTDKSIITWYRQDENPINSTIVAVSHDNFPAKTYTLTKADAGHTIMVSVTPKHIRSHVDKKPQTTISKAVISIPAKEQSKLSENINTTFENFPTFYQPVIAPGLWTVDGFKPKDTYGYDSWTPDTYNSWTFGRGADAGAKSYGLVQTTRGARLLYTPSEAKNYENITLSTTLNPCKSAGQGFGSATGQYMDIYIKYDTKTQSGYGLRIVRTTKYDHAVDFVLMSYSMGTSKAISEPVSTTCFRGNCKINLQFANGNLTVHAETDFKNNYEFQNEVQQTPIANSETKSGESRLTNSFNITVDISKQINSTLIANGIGFQHTGSAGSNATVIKSLSVEWK
jgi:hypothetical protein